jgi:hypothetical protein
LVQIMIRRSAVPVRR